MSVFSETAFVKKLAELNNSQQSIQTLSLWLIHHRKNAKTIVQVWQTQLIQIKVKKKLIFLYLANDVIQNSRKKGTEFIKAFGGVLITAFTHVAKHADEKTLASASRMLNIWNDRKIYDSNYIESIKQAVTNVRSKKNSMSKSSSTSAETAKQPSKKEKDHKKKLKRRAHVLETTNNTDEVASESPADSKSSRLQELIGQKEEDDYLTISPGVPPKPEELAKALGQLENSASADAKIRKKIALLPDELQDVTQLEHITDRAYATDLSQKVNDAVEMLEGYNKRLNDELSHRRVVARMLHDFAQQQQEIISELEANAGSVNDQLTVYDRIGKDLENHIKNLPDFNMLPTVTGGLEPLPSAGDLFN